MLDEVGQLAHSALVHLDHVQVQLELLGDGGMGGLAVLGVLTGLTGRRDRRRDGGEREGGGTAKLVWCIIDQCLLTPVLSDTVVGLKMCHCDL